MKKSMSLSAVLTVLFTVATEAQAARRDVRQHNQRQRIEKGIENGSMTRGEAKRAVQGQRHVNRMERRAEADGHVSLAEKARIEHAQDRQSKDIYRMKHNDKVRAEKPDAPVTPTTGASGSI